jgi:solute carrier family 35 protein
MVFFNKAVLSVYHFTESNLLLLLQMFVSMTVLLGVQKLGLIKLEPFTWERTKALLPVALLYNANVAFALASLNKVNVPMYNVLKRLTPALVLFYDTTFSGKTVSRKVIFSVALTLFGTLVAGYNDLAFDLVGYGMAMASSLLQASYLIVVQKTGAEKSISSNDLLMYNAVLSIPMLFLVVVLDGELTTGMTKLYEGAAQWDFVMVMLCCLHLGMLLNLSIFMCTQNNSALTTTIVGVFKGVAATLLGFLLLGGVQFVPLNFAGIMINLVGGVWYAIIKYQEKQANANKL